MQNNRFYVANKEENEPRKCSDRLHNNKYEHDRTVIITLKTPATKQ